MKPLTGKKAQAQLKKILNDYEKEKPFKYPYLSYGYFKKDNAWTAFDNSSGDCWVESFPTEAKALSWIKGEFQVKH